MSRSRGSGRMRTRRVLRVHRYKPRIVRQGVIVGRQRGGIVRGDAILFSLAPRPRRKVSLRRRPPLFDETRRGAPIELIAGALQSCDCCRIGITRMDIEPLTALARLVGVDHAEIVVEAFVDRCRGGDGDANGENEHARRNHRGSWFAPPGYRFRGHGDAILRPSSFTQATLRRSRPECPRRARTARRRRRGG